MRKLVSLQIEQRLNTLDYLPKRHFIGFCDLRIQSLSTDIHMYNLCNAWNDKGEWSVSNSSKRAE